VTRAPAAIDLLIVGGGVAGLWLLNRAVARGYDALLIERDRLGAGQTIHAQGIVHGGMKYALTGTFTRAAAAIAAMPARWLDCLTGSGELDLRAVSLLSGETFLWSQASLGARMTSFLASRALRGRVDSIPPGDRPEPFRDPAFHGSLYRQAEPVLDTGSLLAALAAPVADRIVRAEISAPDAEGSIAVGDTAIRPARIVLAAGEGNAGLMQRFGLARPAMQRRPLHMVAVEHAQPARLFGHCIGASSVPLVSITSHPAAQGRQVWYLGGGLAEDGVARDPRRQIAAAQTVLKTVLPWIDLGEARWSTLPIDRAEPATAEKARPDTGFAEAIGRIIVAWPTKMTLAPDLADAVLAMLPQPTGTGTACAVASGLPRPAIAKPFWEARP